MLTKNAVDRGSWVTVASRRPISMTRWKACSPRFPMSRSQNGWNRRQLWCQRTSAIPSLLLLLPLNQHVYCWPERETLRTCLHGQVASHARQRPRDQGTCVTPSGRLQLPVHSECGSRVASVPDLINARQSTSLIWLWRHWREWSCLLLLLLLLLLLSLLSSSSSPSL